ncbi:MAG: 50S ribosomal protein L10 [Thermoplasmatales archaeon]|nr:50S ribosomal protein L10 [Thermoplasmatales archaeon]
MPAEWKIKEVEEIKNIISSYQVVGIVGIRGIPAYQMQKIRESLRGKAVIRVSKNNLIKRALSNGSGKLADYIESESAIIASNLNPFKLYKLIESARTKAPAKGGEIASEDIIIKKGETNFKPGPIVGELQKSGIPASIREGKVVIEKDVVLVKKGEVISPQIAQVLGKLDIKPIEIGLKINAFIENGIIYTPDILAVDLVKIFEEIQRCVANAINIAVEICYPARDAINQIIIKAYNSAYHLAIERNIYSGKTIEAFINRAYLHAKALENKIGG